MLKVRTTAAEDQKEPAMKKDRRWMKSVIAASSEVQVTLPWARGTRRRPEALKAQPTAKTQATAAR